MSKTTFSGPIKSGPVQSTTGTNVQSNIADVGFTVVSQSAAVTQNALTVLGLFELEKKQSSFWTIFLASSCVDVVDSK